MAASVPPKNRNFLRILKDKLFRRNRTDIQFDEFGSPTNYVQRMIKILNVAQIRGCMTEEEKSKMAKYIRKNGGFPSEHRSLLWLLASGAERSRKNNPGYFYNNQCDECEHSKHNEPELTSCPRCAKEGAGKEYFGNFEIS